MCPDVTWLKKCLIREVFGVLNWKSSHLTQYPLPLLFQCSCSIWICATFDHLGYDFGCGSGCLGYDEELWRDYVGMDGPGWVSTSLDLKKGKKIASDSLCKWLYAPDLYIKTDAGHFYRNLHSMLNWDTCWVFGIFILHILVYFSFLSASIHLQYIVNSIPQFNNVERNNCIFYCGK